MLIELGEVDFVPSIITYIHSSHRIEIEEEDIPFLASLLRKDESLFRG